jgi:hypothetical protein
MFVGDVQIQQDERVKKDAERREESVADAHSLPRPANNAGASGRVAAYTNDPPISIA